MRRIRQDHPGFETRIRCRKTDRCRIPAITPGLNRPIIICNWIAACFLAMPDAEHATVPRNPQPVTTRPMPDAVYVNCRVATMERGGRPYGLIEDAALAAAGGDIAWVGKRKHLPAGLRSADEVDLEGATATPALIDCHTHIVFAGNRAAEFEQRLHGASYEEIARSGGGILSTMRATRAASEDELVASAVPRLDALLAEGASVVEIKSGYGLSIADELKMLRAARRLATLRPVHVVTSWLAAHAVPPEYAGESDAYIDEVVLAGLARARGENLVDMVDGFCESIAFAPAQIARIFEAADRHGLPKRLHAEQLGNPGGARLAAACGARSADHLEYLDGRGVRALAASGTAAVLLPGACYTLRATRTPPVEALRAADVPMAVATDGNPGSSPLYSLLLAMNMACTLFRLTPEEALLGTTAVAARVLGLEDRHGTLTRGKRADMAVWDIGHPAELAYHVAYNPLRMRIIGGRAC